MVRKRKRSEPSPRLMPRNEHTGREFGVRHLWYYRATYAFLADLGSAEKAYREEVAAGRDAFEVAATYEETPDVERFSLAVQVFAAITIEAAISFYAVLRFGGEHHDDHFRWDGADVRLQAALRDAGISILDDHEALVLVRRVMDARHRIVHPFTVEYSGPEATTVQRPDRPGPDESAAAARQAIADLNRFFALMRDIDPAHARFFDPS